MKKSIATKSPKDIALRRQYKNAVAEVVELRNTLADLVPGGAGAMMGGGQTIDNFQSLAINNRYASLTANRLILSYLYVEHGIIQTAVEQPVHDAFRGGLDITSSELDADDIKLLQDEMERQNDLGIFAEAMIWMRLFGGAGLIINTGDDPATPFDINELTELKRLEFYAADRWELNAGHRGAEFYGFYKVPRLHSSRVLHFVGKSAPSAIRPQLAGWGMSECERMVRDLNSYLKNKNVIFDLLDEAKIDVYKIKGLNTRLATATGTEKVRRQIEISNQLKNYNNAIIMDTLDEYEQKTQTFSGLAEMAKENQMGIASALRMPISKIFGIAATGFSSGEDDLENYNAQVETDIRTPARPQLATMIQLRAIKLFGFKPDIHFKYKPLRVMSEEQEEQIKTSRQNRINSVYSLNLINSKEHAEAMRAYDLMPIETEAEKGLLDDHPQGAGAFGSAFGGQEPGQVPGAQGKDSPEDARDAKEAKNGRVSKRKDSASRRQVNP